MRCVGAPAVSDETARMRDQVVERIEPLPGREPFLASRAPCQLEVRPSRSTSETRPAALPTSVCIPRPSGTPLAGRHAVPSDENHAFARVPDPSGYGGGEAGRSGLFTAPTPTNKSSVATRSFKRPCSSPAGPSSLRHSSALDARKTVDPSSASSPTSQCMKQKPLGPAAINSSARLAMARRGVPDRSTSASEVVHDRPSRDVHRAPDQPNGSESTRNPRRHSDRQAVLRQTDWKCRSRSQRALSSEGARQAHPPSRWVAVFSFRSARARDPWWELDAWWEWDPPRDWSSCLPKVSGWCSD